MTIAIHITDAAAPDELVYVFADHASTGSAQALGSASILVDESGNPIPNSAARYYPFGDWRTEPTADETSRWYTGHVHNNLSRNDLGLIYMNARFYLPGLGRFVSADTIVPDAANPQSLNRYTYVFNQPTNLTDPSGHCPWCLGALGGAIGGGLAAYGKQVLGNLQGGMTLAASLTTDIDPAKVMAGAIGGAIIGGTFGLAAAAGGGTLAGLGLLEASKYGAIGYFAAGQARSLTEATVSQAIDHLQGSNEFEIARLWDEAHGLGLLDPQTMIVDAVSGAVGGGIAWGFSSLLTVLAQDSGIIPVSSSSSAIPTIKGFMKTGPGEGFTLYIETEQRSIYMGEISRGVFAEFLRLLNLYGVDRAAKFLSNQVQSTIDKESQP